MTVSEKAVPEGAWNPGLRSDIPNYLWPKVTLFSEGNGFVQHEEAAELSDLTGIAVLELFSLQPKRLMIHALLVRVTADLTVPDGPLYAELGINLRSMVKVIYDNHVAPIMPSVESTFAERRQEALAFINTKLDQGGSGGSTNAASSGAELIATDDVAAEKSFIRRWFSRRKTQPDNKPGQKDNHDLLMIDAWRNEKAAAVSHLEQTCLESLIKCVGKIISHRGSMLPDHELLARITANRTMNTVGALIVDSALDTIWLQAVAAEGFRLLPAQQKPVVMNVKGASAAGKSTIRPQQRQLAQKLAIAWEDFALISPDYWRKYLLDYASLGEHYKYGAMLTGRELEIVDKKLDDYMANKAANNTLSHLLIDRFRFDSFVVDVDRAPGSKLLSRFGDRVFLFFVVTDPAETVVRAWRRGQSTGRYKAVDDLLYHNVEAFTGMPDLFLTWVNSKDKDIQFEFLNNNVPEGNLPETAAFGINNILVVLDISLVLNIERFRKVSIHAQKPEEVFNLSDLEPAENTGFIERCAARLETIVLADKHSLKEYARVTDGKLTWWDEQYIKQNASIAGLQQVLDVLGYQGEPCSEAVPTDTPLQNILKQGSDAQNCLLVGHLSTLHT